MKHIPGKLTTIPAKDEIPKNSQISDVREAQNQKMSETVGLINVNQCQSKSMSGLC